MYMQKCINVYAGWPVMDCRLTQHELSYRVLNVTEIGPTTTLTGKKPLQSITAGHFKTVDCSGTSIGT